MGENRTVALDARRGAKIGVDTALSTPLPTAREPRSKLVRGVVLQIPPRPLVSVRARWEARGRKEMKGGAGEEPNGAGIVRGIFPRIQRKRVASTGLPASGEREGSQVEWQGATGGRIERGKPDREGSGVISHGCCICARRGASRAHTAPSNRSRPIWETRNGLPRLKKPTVNGWYSPEEACWKFTVAPFDSS